MSLPTSGTKGFRSMMQQKSVGVLSRIRSLSICEGGGLSLSLSPSPEKFGMGNLPLSNCCDLSFIWA